MSQPTPAADGKRLVNYRGLLKYIESKGVPITDKGLRSRISRGTVPKVPAPPRPGQNNRFMFDLDAIDEWLAGGWRKVA